MRKVADYALWVGNASDIRDARSLFASDITAVVELADCEPFVELPRELLRCRFPLSDGGDNPPWILRLAAESVATLLRNDVPVLVCCSAGLSRSIVVAAAAVSLIAARPLAEALATVVGSGPADVSPGLLFQMRQVLET